MVWRSTNNPRYAHAQVGSLISPLGSTSAYSILCLFVELVCTTVCHRLSHTLPV